MEKPKTKQSKASTEFFINFANHGNKSLPGKLIDPKNILERVRLESSRIPEIQPKLRKILDEVIKEKKLTDSKELQFFTKICERYRDKYKVSDGKLEKRKIYDSARKWNWEVYSEWLQELSLSLIGFLSDPKTDLRKIKKCQLCEEYYIAKQLRDIQKFCSPKCKRLNQWPPERRNEYMREWQKEKKEKGQKENREMIIQRLIDGGCNREEAIEIVKADEEMK